MDYNQQRRTRNGSYNRGRQMNYGRQGQNGCGCDNSVSEAERNMAARQSGCDTCSRQMERETRTARVSWDGNCDKNYDRNCDCQMQRDTCGCAARSCTYMRQKGYLEESESYPIGMSYTPWQSWGCTYDGHRALMSGTIFPELDKPFCAAGRCNR